MADEPTTPAPVAPAAPAAGPAPAPAAPIDPVEYANLKASHAALEAHKAKVDREREKERAERAREKQEREAHRALLVKAGILPDDTSDPSEQLKKREEAERAARETETAMELNLSRALFGKQLTPKDGDLDYVLYKVRKDATLRDAATAGITDEFLESLRARGYVSTVSAPAPAATAPAPKPDAKAAAPGAAATPADPVLAGLKDFRQFTALPVSKQVELRAKYPDHINNLKAMQERRFSSSLR